MQEAENMMEDKAEGGMEEGTSIELLIAPDGTMSVTSEDESESENESEEDYKPAKSLDEALMMIKQMAESVLGQSGQTEDEAYKAEMQQPMSGKSY